MAKTLGEYKSLFLREVEKINDFIKEENSDIRTALAVMEKALQQNESNLKNE